MEENILFWVYKPGQVLTSRTGGVRDIGHRT